MIRRVAVLEAALVPAVVLRVADGAVPHQRDVERPVASPSGNLEVKRKLILISNLQTLAISCIEGKTLESRSSIINLLEHLYTRMLVVGFILLQLVS